MRVCKAYFSKRDPQRYPKGLVRELAFVVEVVAQIMSACHLQLRLARLSKICQDRTVPLLAATYLLEDQMAYQTHSKLR